MMFMDVRCILLGYLVIQRFQPLSVRFDSMKAAYVSHEILFTVCIRSSCSPVQACIMPVHLWLSACDIADQGVDGSGFPLPRRHPRQRPFWFPRFSQNSMRKFEAVGVLTLYWFRVWVVVERSCRLCFGPLDRNFLLQWHRPIGGTYCVCHSLRKVTKNFLA